MLTGTFTGCITTIVKLRQLIDNR